MIASLGQLMSNSERDLLTGLPNRHGFDRIFASAVDRAQAGGPRPTVVLVVLEGLDAIGDKYGHQAGDQLIRSTVDGWRGYCTPNTYWPDSAMTSLPSCCPAAPSTKASR